MTQSRICVLYVGYELVVTDVYKKSLPCRFCGFAFVRNDDKERVLFGDVIYISDV